jgi:ribosomal protein L29
MAILRTKDILSLNDKERKEKLKELRFELIRANVTANKSGKIKIKEIRKTIAKILTLMAKGHKKP